MIKLITDINDQPIEISQEHADFSPYLKTLIGTDVLTDRIDDSYCIADVSYDELVSYVEYCKTGNYDDNVLTIDLMDYMGHNTIDVGTLSNLDGYAKIYYEDYWIRDNRDLTPFHGLEHIHTIDNNDLYPSMTFINSILDGITYYIAGGYAAYLANKTVGYSDIDIFVCSRHYDVIDRLQTLNVEITITRYAASFILSGMKYQVILCRYDTPSQILHMFDICSCQYLLDPVTNNIYCTKMALWSNRHKKIVFDSLRYSDSYVYRLWKYMTRQQGFKIILPNEELVMRLYENNKYKLIDAVRIPISNDNCYMLDCIENSDAYKKILHDNKISETYDRFIAISIINSGKPYSLDDKYNIISKFNASSRLIFLLGIVDINMEYESSYDFPMEIHSEVEWKDPYVFQFGKHPYDTIEDLLETNNFKDLH